MVPRLFRTTLALAALALLAAAPLARADTYEAYAGVTLAPPVGAAFEWSYCWSASEGGMMSLSSTRCEEAGRASAPWGVEGGATGADRIVVGFILLGENRCLMVDAGGVQTCNIPEPCLEERLLCGP